MAEGTAATIAWQIEYNDRSAQVLAESLGTALGEAGRPCPANYVRPLHGTYGTPEVVITILAASLSKAVILWGLDALEKKLSAHLQVNTDENVRVVVDGGSATKEQFPLSMRGLTREFVAQFIAEIKDYVAKL